MKSLVLLAALAGLLAASPVSAKLTPEQLKSLPAPAARPVDFATDIQPMLETACVKCHGRGRQKGDFSLETRATLLKGGESGPAVVPGRSAESYLIELVSGLDPDNVMPVKGSKLKPEQVALLRAWIDQGLPWDERVTFAKPPAANLQPQTPALPPPSRTVANPVDRLLQPYFAANKIAANKLVDDRTFARRVYLDVIGLLPAPVELNAFLADKRADKREQLVKHLLADNHRYAEHWLSFWNDLLRNDYKGTGYIDGGRKQITGWLWGALATNLPYDKFVAQLVNPTPESEGFSKGIVWRGVVNASMTPPMQAAQNISQVFMGVNLKCASCHDSFINDWTLADAYGLASIYADSPLEMVLCDKPTGRKAAMKFLYPELGVIDGAAPRSERLQRLAQIITQKNNGRLTRTIVNRLWARFLGRGLVEPVDEMEQSAWNQDLLDWLAEDLAAHGHDLRKTMERILTSRAYQLPAVSLGEQSRDEFVFRGPLVRRLTAEQFRDALLTLTGVGYTLPGGDVDFTLGTGPELAATVTGSPQWIWNSAQAATSARVETIYLRKTIVLPERPTDAVAILTCDNSYTLYVNGQRIRTGDDYTKFNLANLQPELKPGKNVIAVQAVNGAGAGKPNEPNPAGFFFHAVVRYKPAIGGASGEKMMDFSSDGSWIWSARKSGGWEKPEFAATDWKPVSTLGGPDISPWGAGKNFRAALTAAAHYGVFRAGLAPADSLMLALGRPNREVVVSTRASAATTLQALELTNGAMLAGLLKDGAARWVADKNGGGGRDLVQRLYARALGRKPSSAELRLGEETVGATPGKEGVEDLLWAVTMLPEFQLIY